MINQRFVCWVENFRHFVIKKNWKNNILSQIFIFLFFEKSKFFVFKIALNCHNLLTMKGCLRFFTFIFRIFSNVAKYT